MMQTNGQQVWLWWVSETVMVNRKLLGGAGFADAIPKVLTARYVATRIRRTWQG